MKNVLVSKDKLNDYIDCGDEIASVVDDEQSLAKAVKKMLNECYGTDLVLFKPVAVFKGSAIKDNKGIITGMEYTVPPEVKAEATTKPAKTSSKRK